MKTIKQLLSEIENLKIRITKIDSPLYDNETWSIQHKLQVACGQLLIGFQEVALEHGVEIDLWNVGFKTTINQLQSIVKDNKESHVEAKEVLNWFLNSASGFYLQLLNQISSANSLDFVFRRRDSVYGLVGGGLSSAPGMKVKDSSTKSALYLCQYCLIHLGDLARYRHQAKQAETFYKHAVTVAASSGQPYNQLALLEAGKGNRLASVFLYIRSLCVTAPFPVAPSNLIQTLNKVLDKSKNSNPTSTELKIGMLTRMTKEEYINLFLHFHSSLIIKGDVESSKDDLPHLSSALSMLVATTTLTRASLVQMFAINVFSHDYFSGRCSIKIGDDNRKEEERLAEPKECVGALELIEELTVGMLAALLLPIHTIKEGEVVLAYPALPAIRLIFEWILLEDKLSCPSLKEKQQIWPGLCTTVNFLQKSLVNFDYSEYKETPLPEDWDLQGFQPLSKILNRYKFKEGAERLTPDKYSLLRAKRLTDLATRVSLQIVEGGAVIRKSWEGDECPKFEPQSNQSPPVEEVLDLERLTLHPVQQRKEKVGILKPQGSLEKANENKHKKMKDGKIEIKSKENKRQIKEVNKKNLQQGISGDSKRIPISGDSKKIPISGSGTSILVSSADSGSAIGGNPQIRIPSNDNLSSSGSLNKPRLRTNVALQAILKRNSMNAQEQPKQVKFQTPSPAVSPNLSETSIGNQRMKMSSPLPLGAPGGPMMQHLGTGGANVSAYTEVPFVPPHDHSPGSYKPSLPHQNNLPISSPPDVGEGFGSIFAQQIPSFMLGSMPQGRGNAWNKTSPPTNLLNPSWNKPNSDSLIASNVYAKTTDKNLLHDNQAVLRNQFPNQPFFPPSTVQNRMVFMNQGAEQIPRNTLSPPNSVKLFMDKNIPSLFKEQNINPINYVGPVPNTIQRSNITPAMNIHNIDTMGINTSQGNAVGLDRPMNQFNPLSSNDISRANNLTQAMNSNVNLQKSLTSNFNTYPSAPNTNLKNAWFEDSSKIPAMYLPQQLMNKPPHSRMQTNEPNLGGNHEAYQRHHLSNIDHELDHKLSNEPRNYAERPSNTYSLFGPLGGGETLPPRQFIPPSHMPSSDAHNPSQQSLWSGPSPLQRLLEQKKFSNK